MKKLNIAHFAISFFLVAYLFVMPSCSKMNDTQAKFADRGEHIYLGKVDSIQSFPGLKRAKLTWYIGSDPRIDQTIIYWNNRRDSLIVDFNRSIPGVQKDSVIIDSLPEGTFLFEFRNINKKGESSLYSSASVTIWGSTFADGLHRRIINDFDFNNDQKTYTFGLSPTVQGDGVVYSQMVYSDMQGIKHTIRIATDTDKVELDNFPAGGELLFTSAFNPPGGIDTIYTDNDTLYAPSIVSGQGTRLSLTGGINNQYFSRGDSLYEWTANGDLNKYMFTANDSLDQFESLPSVILRKDYKFFFFYDADRFIGISTANQITMLKEDSSTFTKISAFGNGFNFMKFIPAIGFLYSVTSGTGDLRTWIAKDDATWGSPNGTTVGKGFDKYDPLMLFDGRDLLAVDSGGYLWSMAITADGRISTGRRIGSGWNRFIKMVSVGTKLLGMEQNGDFYLFDNFKAEGSSFYIVN